MIVFKLYLWVSKICGMSARGISGFVCRRFFFSGKLESLSEEDLEVLRDLGSDDFELVPVNWPVSHTQRKPNSLYAEEWKQRPERHLYWFQTKSGRTEPNGPMNLPYIKPLIWSEWRRGWDLSDLCAFFHFSLSLVCGLCFSLVFLAFCLVKFKCLILFCYLIVSH